MNSPDKKHLNIKAACEDLEMALLNFEDDKEAKENVKKENDRIEDMKVRLREIKDQLDELA